MSAPSRKLIQRFAITFGLGSAAIGTGVLLSSGSHDGNDRVADTTTPVTSNTPIALAPSSIPSTTEIVATMPTEVDGADGADASPVSESAATEATQVTVSRPLPVPDLAAFCVTLYGQGTTAVGSDDVTTAQCGLTSGATADIDLDAACRAQFGAGDAVQIAVQPRGIRCTDPAAVALGPVDYGEYCDQVYGEAAKQALVADDWQGWRCAGVGNGVFQLFELKPGTVCQTVVDRETYALAADKTTNAWFCYGLP